VGPGALIELARRPLVNPVQRPDWPADLGEVLLQQIVVLQFRLDALEHVLGVLFVGADEGDELPMPIE
jgi:hypothetical protein